MRGRVVFSLTLCIVLVSVSGRADNAPRLLAQCRDISNRSHADLDLTLVRQQGMWQVTAVTAGQSDLASLASLDTLESAEIGGDRPVAARQIHCLAALPHLKRLVLPRTSSESEVDAISSLAELRHLEWVGYPAGAKMSNASLARLGCLRNLRCLDLAMLKLDDRSLTYVMRMKSLERLNLTYNRQITDAGLAQLKGLHRLRSLALSGIGAAGLAALAELPDLEELEIGAVDPATGPIDLSGLKHVKRLKLSSADSVRKIRLPPDLCSLGLSCRVAGNLDLLSARHIEQVQVELYGEEPPRDLTWLKSLPQLRELTLNSPVDADVKAVASLTSLRALTLSGYCPDITFGDDSVNELRELRQLECLRIERSRLTDTGMRVVSNFTNLQKFVLVSCPDVTTKGLAGIWELKQLRALDSDSIDNVPEGGGESLVPRIKALTQLEELVLHGSVNDDGIGSLEHLKKLRDLDLTWAIGFSDKALLSLISELPNLQTLKVAIRSAPDEQ